jgi:hypothetical protein
MCGIMQERKRIDEILELAIPETAFPARHDDNTLVEIALVALREHYADICSEEYMHARCEAFVTRLKRQRWMSGGTEIEPASIYSL